MHLYSLWAFQRYQECGMKRCGYRDLNMIKQNKTNYLALKIDHITNILKSLHNKSSCVKCFFFKFVRWLGSQSCTREFSQICLQMRLEEESRKVQKFRNYGIFWQMLKPIVLNHSGKRILHNVANNEVTMTSSPCTKFKKVWPLLSVKECH
jgi:hypothetical protein